MCVVFVFGGCCFYVKSPFMSCPLCLSVSLSVCQGGKRKDRGRDKEKQRGERDACNCESCTTDKTNNHLQVGTSQTDRGEMSNEGVR